MIGSQARIGGFKSVTSGGFPAHDVGAGCARTGRSAEADGLLFQGGPRGGPRGFRLWPDLRGEDPSIRCRDGLPEVVSRSRFGSEAGRPCTRSLRGVVRFATNGRINAAYAAILPCSRKGKSPANKGIVRKHRGRSVYSEPRVLSCSSLSSSYLSRSSVSTTSKGGSE